MTGNPPETAKLSSLTALALLMVIALSWGMSWPVNKALLTYVSPIWAVSTRLTLAAAVFGVIALLAGKLRLPPRQDLPMVVSLAVLHMSVFAVLTSLGLVYVSAGRTVLLAYTTPLWVFPLAWLFMGQKQYYAIGEVSQMFKVNASLLRFWESEFDIIKPRKNKKGDRHFRPVDIKNLQLIYDLLRRRKLTIDGAKDFLKNNKKSQERFNMIQSLQKIKGFLLEIKASL